MRSWWKSMQGLRTLPGYMQVQKLLGKGSYGTVYRVRRKSDSQVKGIKGCLCSLVQNDVDLLIFMLLTTCTPDLCLERSRCAADVPSRAHGKTSSCLCICGIEGHPFCTWCYAEHIGFTFIQPLQDAVNEIRLLASVQHSNIVKYHEAFLEGADGGWKHQHYSPALQVLWGTFLVVGLYRRYCRYHIELFSGGKYDGT
jgi:serine/threonine protein kinase